MSLIRLIKQTHRYLLLATAAILISACGGGGGGSSSSLSGTAATGAPVQGFVYVTDSTGIEVNAPINPDGSFSISVEGMTPPFILRVIPDDNSDILYSYASGSNLTVNITPLTTLALFIAGSGNLDLDALYLDWVNSSSLLDDTSITAAQEEINANLLSLFNDNGVDATFYDFMNVAFSADGNSIDGVMDALTISIDSTGGVFTVSINGTPYEWDQLIDTSGINIGDFAIPGSSTWQLTVSDAVNGTGPDTVIVPGLLVPNSLDDFEAISNETLNAQFVFDGLEVTVDLSDISLDVAGSGEVGTLISGHFAGTVTINGQFGEVIFNNETYNFDVTYSWERLADNI